MLIMGWTCPKITILYAILVVRLIELYAKKSCGLNLSTFISFIFVLNDWFLIPGWIPDKTKQIFLILRDSYSWNNYPYHKWYCRDELIEFMK